MKEIIRYTIILFLIPVHFMLAQESKKNSIKAVHSVSNEKVELRWAPSNYQFWQKTIESGYMIERFTVIKNDSLLPKPTVKISNSGIILPKVLDDWEELAMKDDYAAIAAQCLYGEELNILGSENDVFSIYNKANEQNSRHSLAMFSADQSVETAKYLGLYFADEEINMDEAYLYRIYTPLSDVSYDTALVYVDLRVPSGGLSKIDDIMAEQNDNNTILLQWDINIIESDYISYDVLRRNKHSDFDFEKINKQSLIYIEKEQKKQVGSKYMIYVDSVTNEGDYQYLISGKTIFGKQRIISDTLNLEINFEESLPSPFIMNHDFINEKLNVKWNIDGENWRESYQAILLSSESVDGVYKVIDYKKELTDFQLDSFNNMAYYKIRLKDKNGRFKESNRYMIQAIDSIPPLPPIGLKGEINENGGVRLSWEANSEDDLLGYKIFKSNYAGEEPSELTATILKENNYFEKLSLKTLNDKVHYYIAALDQNYNQSALSQPLILNRPSSVKPDAPFIKNVVQDGEEVTIHFAKSSSKDINKYLVYARKNTEKFRLLGIANSTDESFYFDIPSFPANQLIYDFIMIAVNKNGSESDVSNMVSKIFLVDKKKEKLQFNSELVNDVIIVKIKEIDDVYRTIKIYRNVSDQGYLLFSDYMENNGEILIKSCKVECTYLIIIETESKLYEASIKG